MILHDYYREYKEDERLIKDNAHRVEFDTTKISLEGYLKDVYSILDIGAGTGRYSFYFADLGYNVTALEYADSNINLLNQKNKATSDNKKIRIIQGDGRDLSCFKDDSFDLVLCMGPIYHLGSKDDKIKCINESKRVAKPGSILAFSYINKLAQYTNEIYHDYNNLFDPYVDALIYDNQKLLSQGLLNFDSPSKIEDMMNECRIDKISHIGTDGISYLLNKSINSFDEYTYQKWLSNHLRICSEASILGYSLHGLFIGRKNI